ncbi:4,5:9,10-diseco-3-hydroxy-5,9, 17-trioxoandrosta-1(10),2-diene-4-oate hydrolase [Grimontia celer]|uniref:4,5:9,10-diseco-3-hydroxy-5,9, 17-trioxoandrosta-1(10),2-diene-4-oate hydrolase n=1 Tax=Grimontia celer TaxID=1796497 RepID=A0A128F8R0_9GAMM|nr:alpha/beta hydrolase [Grimontia celer]CZF82744.1 4,5:9,10-diseco-3-hydroxy-5,9, 17-trioxoandrosta-1(10),2-diene-4-oate hydrolase [Grimontia celer]
MAKRPVFGVFLILMVSIYPGFATADKNEMPAPSDTEAWIKIAGNPDAERRVVFIHGSPGSKEAYDDYLGHPALQHLELVSVDRPGFGESGRPVETSIQKQAEALMDLVNSGKETWVVGHSLGGPIALQLALLAPDRVSGLLLIASAFDPKLESPKWYNIITDTLLANWILPDDLLKSNREMMVLDKELEKLAAQNWSTLDMPVLLVHGAEDDLADPGNSLFAKAKLPAAELMMMPDEGHFILWENVPLLVDQINTLVSK